MKPWDGLVDEEDMRAYELAGFGQPSGLGKNPALLIIDVQYRTSGSRPMPFEKAVTEYATSCGAVAWDAISNIKKLVNCFRCQNWPVLYAFVAPKEKQTDSGRLAEKVPAIMNIASQGYDFVTEIEPEPGDVLIPKKHPSAFFGTALTSHLIDLRADTLIITGCSTSGCVRASAVDAFSLNFRVQVPQDAVYDRSRISHAISLFDLSQKYADVLPTHTLIKSLEELR